MKQFMTTIVCSLLLAVGWNSAWAQSPTAQRIGLRVVDNKSTFNNNAELNEYENILGLYQLNEDYPITAGMLNQGDNHITLYRQGQGEDEFAPAVRINLSAQDSIPTPKYLSALSFTNAPSTQTTITAAMLPDNWGTTTDGLIWQTNGSAYIAASGGLTYTVPEGYSNATLQLVVYVGSDVRGGYFTFNFNTEGWYISSEVSAGGSYILKSFPNVSSGQTIVIYGGMKENGSSYTYQSPDITQIGFRYIPDSYIPLVKVTPTTSHMGNEGWSDEDPLDAPKHTYTVNDLVDLDELQVSDIFSVSTTDNGHPDYYNYKADFEANIEIPISGSTGTDYYASADFAAATSATPSAAAFDGENNWSFYNTNVYTPSAGRCAYMLFYGRIVYRMPAYFMGSSVNVTMTSSNSSDGAGDIYVNGVLHTFTAGETYTWTVPVVAGGAIEFKGVSDTFSIDFTKIIISSGNGAPSGAPRHDNTMPQSYQMTGIDGKTVMPQPIEESKTKPNSMIRIND